MHQYYGVKGSDPNDGVLLQGGCTSYTSVWLGNIGCIRFSNETGERLRLVEKIRQLKHREAELERRETERERRETEREAEIEELIQQIEQRERRFSSGTYYTTISALWDEDTRPPLTEDQYGAIQRTEMPSDDAIFGEYNTTLQLALDENSVAKDGVHGSRGSHSATDVRNTIWPNNVLHNTRSGDIAHLVPAGPSLTKTWWFVASWLYGGMQAVTQENFTYEFCMKILNGCGLIENNHMTDKRRHGSGVKHWVTNKARILGQAKIYDSYPCLLIVPILTPQQAVNWDGEGYNAIVVIDDDHPDRSLRDVAYSSGLSQDPIENDHLLANNEDVETARYLLEQYLRGSVNAKMIARDSQYFQFPDGYPGQAYNSATEITVPVTLRVLPASMKVRKVTFKGINEAVDNDNGGHRAPNPILLTAKAACVFSKRHGVEAMAAGPGPDDMIDDNWSDGDDAALERFIEAQQQALRPPDNWNDFARAMGQSGAAQPASGLE